MSLEKDMEIINSRQREYDGVETMAESAARLGVPSGPDALTINSAAAQIRLLKEEPCSGKVN